MPEEVVACVFCVQLDDVHTLELADAVGTVLRLDELCRRPDLLSEYDVTGCSERQPNTPVCDGKHCEAALRVALELVYTVLPLFVFLTTVDAHPREAFAGLAVHLLLFEGEVGLAQADFDGVQHAGVVREYQLLGVTEVIDFCLNHFDAVVQNLLCH